MTNELIAIDRDHLTTTCGGTAATSPWASFETDLKGRIDSEMAAARTRFDNYKPTMPTMPSGDYTHCFPTVNTKR